MSTLKSKLFMLTLLLIGVVAMSFVFVGKSEPKVENKQQGLHWFQVNSNIAPGQPVTNADVTYITQSLTPPPGTGCGGDDLQCVSGFNDEQVNSLKEIIRSQTPDSEPFQKNN